MGEIIGWEDVRDSGQSEKVFGQACLLGVVVEFVEKSCRVGCSHGKADWRKEEAKRG